MPDSARVISFINGPDCKIEARLTADSSLIKSGLLDSMALFHLSLWIEEEVGHPIDPGEIDIAEVWDTPNAIAHFISNKKTNGL